MYDKESMKRILLIEPEFYNRVDLEDTLSPHGFQVVSVKDRFSALMKLKSQVFNLMMTGLKDDPGELFFLLKSLRESGSTIPVVILAHLPTMEVIQKLSRYAPLEVVVQPYSIKNLVSKLEQVIEVHRK